MKLKKTTIVMLCIIGLMLLVNLFARLCTPAADFYIMHIFPLISGFWSRITGLFPFSVGEWMIVIGVVLLILLVPGYVVLLKIVKKQFGVEEADFLSAELEVVPAGMPREVGLDRSLIAAYGHDDRVCAYAGLSALLKLKGVPDVTASIVMCDKEEIGSMGATGMQSSFFENTVAEMLVRQGAKADIDVRRCLEKSTMLSADVTAAADPHFKDVDSTGNEAKLKGGPAVSKYTGGKVTWQMAELGKMEKGGGGTISQYMARFGMDVIDFGTPLLNMHAPWELASKEDCYWTYRAYRAYFQS